MPSDFSAAFSLGRQHLLGERWGEASAALLTAISIRPDAWAIRGLLGVALLRAGRPEDAIRELTRTLSERPDDIPARLHLGMALLAIGQNTACEAAMRAVVARRPGDVEAWRHIIAARQGLGKLAIRARTRLTELTPADPEAWAGLGAAWMERGAPQPAITCLRRVLSLRCDDLAARCRLGLLLLDVGEIDAAEAELQAVLAAVPESSSARTGLARIRSWRRDRDGARKLIASLLAGATPPVEAVALWAELNRKQPDAAIPAVTSALERSLTDAERSLLLHRLGDLRDAIGSHDAAFSAWQEANHLRHARFNPVAHDRAVDALIDAYRRPHLHAVCDSEVPVFIVGMPRSGTSLLEQMLDRHPEIAGAGELESIRQIASGLSRPVDYYLRLEQLTAPHLTGLAQTHVQTLQTLGGAARRVVDKMPNNFLHLGLISQLFPQTRVLHVVRDPADTCLSCFRQRLGAGLPHTTRLEWLGAYYRSYVRLMAHWESTLPITIHRVRYADLVRTPEETIRGVLSVLGVGWDSRCLSPHRSDRIVATASREQVQQPLYTHAIGRAAPYRRHLAALHQALDGEV